MEIKPFIKWAGGKQKIIKQLLPFVSADFEKRDYKEPFLGAGSMFFALKPENSFISDTNEKLIDCYNNIKNNYELIYNYIIEHLKKSNKEYYYKIREIFNNSELSAEQSARFIYLIQACWRGKFSVNKKNKFNSSFGYARSISLPSKNKLKIVSEILKKSKIFNLDYKSILPMIKNNDFIYLDPPYPPLSKTAKFTNYTKDGFSENNHLELADFVNKINKIGSKFMMSNADTKLIRHLYSNYNLYNISVLRYIPLKNKKKADELIITNYDDFRG